MIPNVAPVRGALRWAALCTLLLAWSLPAAGRTLNVPSTYATIQAAFSAAASGDTILLAPGVHTGRPTLSGKAVTLGSRFLTTGDRDYIDQTIIDGTAGTYALRVSSPGPMPTIVGVTLRNADDGIAATAKFQLLSCRVTDTSDGIDYAAGGGGVVRDCLFEGNSDDGIDCDYAVDVLIENNLIRNNGDDGIEIRMQPYTGTLLNILIRNNTITGNDEDGIQLISYEVLTSRKIEIEGNLILNNAMAGVGMMCCENTTENYAGAAIKERVGLYRNTIIGNDHGVTGGDNLIALNNLILNSTRIGLKRATAGSVAAYNLFHGNQTNHTGSNVDVITTLVQNPLLAVDYGLESASPAIDAGVASFSVLGTPVWQLDEEDYSGPAPDLGAFEYSGLLPVAEDALPARVELLAPSPNPSRGATLFRIQLPSASATRLEIIDIAGRRVRSLVDGELPPGRHQFSWNGTGDSGVIAPAGLYIVRLETASGSRALRFARL